jgi:hypothetical protein
MTAPPMSPRDRAIWVRARPYLDVRNNDEHTLQSYWIVRALLAVHPEAREDIVLPAMILHDVGWKRVPQDQLLNAIGPSPSRPDLVRVHEVEGAVIARAEIGDMGLPLDAIAAIIDGHDTRKEAISLEDAIVKDADKIWRFTPHGVAIMCGWWDWTEDKTRTVLSEFVVPQLLTVPGRAMALGFLATAAATAATPDLMKAST